MTDLERRLLACDLIEAAMGDRLARIPEPMLVMTRMAILSKDEDLRRYIRDAAGFRRAAIWRQDARERSASPIMDALDALQILTHDDAPENRRTWADHALWILFEGCIPKEKIMPTEGIRLLFRAIVYGKDQTAWGPLADALEEQGLDLPTSRLDSARGEGKD